MWRSCVFGKRHRRGTLSAASQPRRNHAATARIGATAMTVRMTGDGSFPSRESFGISVSRLLLWWAQQHLSQSTRASDVPNAPPCRGRVGLAQGTTNVPARLFADVRARPHHRTGLSLLLVALHRSSTFACIRSGGIPPRRSLSPPAFDELDHARQLLPPSPPTSPPYGSHSWHSHRPAGSP